MIIYHPCPNCKEHVTTQSSAPTPQELERDKGEIFSLTCTDCATTFRAEAMQTRSKINPIKIGIGIGLSIVLAFVFWEMGLIGSLCAAPAIILYLTETNSVTAYNRQSKRRWG